jgi:hypothetical protein
MQSTKRSPPPWRFHLIAIDAGQAEAADNRRVQLINLGFLKQRLSLGQSLLLMRRFRP